VPSGTVYFDELLDPYIKNNDVWGCPSTSTQTAANHTRSIGMNEVVAVPFARFHPTGGQWNPIPLSDVQTPADLIVMNETRPNAAFTDISFGTGSFGQAFQACRAANLDASGNVNIASTANNLIAHYLRHNRGANYAFADGHAKWFRPQQTLTPNVQWFVNRPALNALPSDCNQVTPLRKDANYPP
jgi:prepilin-type processing-associated H-X9-DG protein